MKALQWNALPAERQCEHVLAMPVFAVRHPRTAGPLGALRDPEPHRQNCQLARVLLLPCKTDCGAHGCEAHSLRMYDSSLGPWMGRNQISKVLCAASKLVLRHKELQPMG